MRKLTKRYLMLGLTSMIVLPVCAFSEPDMASLQASAKAGNINAAMKLAYLNTQQHRDLDAFHWYSVAAKSGDPNAISSLGLMYAMGRGVPRNTKKALSLILPVAERGNKNAQYDMSMIYYNGYLGAPNYQRAAYWLKKSAKQGKPQALFNLGQIYFFGHLGKPDRLKGIALYTKAAYKGYTLAQYKLGGVYGAGPYYGLQQNIPMAYTWSMISKINGYQPDHPEYVINHTHAFSAYPYCIAQGQSNIGVMYSRGLAGLPKDGAKAMSWMQRANKTDPNFAGIQLNLAKFYYAGIGTNPMPKLALQYAQKAAKAPYGPAQQYLAQFYFNGVGTKKDLVKAYAWLLKAKHTYNHPDKQFYAKYKAPCRPSPVGDALQNAQSAQAQMDAIKPHLSQAELSKATTLSGA
jgi:TPR repeat protein